MCIDIQNAYSRRNNQEPVLPKLAFPKQSADFDSVGSSKHHWPGNKVPESITLIDSKNVTTKIDLTVQKEGGKKTKLESGETLISENRQYRVSYTEKPDGIHITVDHLFPGDVKWSFTETNSKEVISGIVTINKGDRIALAPGKAVKVGSDFFSADSVTYKLKQKPDKVLIESSSGQKQELNLENLKEGPNLIDNKGWYQVSYTIDPNDHSCNLKIDFHTKVEAEKPILTGNGKEFFLKTNIIKKDFPRPNDF